MEINISLLLIKSRLEYVVDAIALPKTPFGKKGLIPQLRGVLPEIASSWQLSLGIVLAEDNCLTQRLTSQGQLASSDWFSLGAQSPGPLTAVWNRSVGVLRPLLGLHCCSASPSIHSAFFCSLLQVAIPRALPINFLHGIPNNSAWNASSQGKHSGGGSIWLRFGTKSETGKQRVYVIHSRVQHKGWPKELKDSAQMFYKHSPSRPGPGIGPEAVIVECIDNSEEWVFSIRFRWWVMFALYNKSTGTSHIKQE